MSNSQEIFFLRFSIVEPNAFELESNVDGKCSLYQRPNVSANVKSCYTP